MKDKGKFDEHEYMGMQYLLAVLKIYTTLPDLLKDKIPYVPGGKRDLAMLKSKTEKISAELFAMIADEKKKQHAIDECCKSDVVIHTIKDVALVNTVKRYVYAEKPCIDTLSCTAQKAECTFCNMSQMEAKQKCLLYRAFEGIYGWTPPQGKTKCCKYALMTIEENEK